MNDVFTATDTATAAPALTVTVTFAEGTDGNVLATLLKQHIEAVVAADPRKADAAARLHGRLGIRSTEPPAEVTLVFAPGGVTIRNGIEPGVDGTITGPLKLQTETLVAKANPYTAMLRRQLKVRIRLSRPLFTAQAYSFLKVPPSLRPKD
ncbi:MAG: SCP2 sterol-binding domain-containing protein [Dehalococcoidia bacterium]